MSHGGRRGFSNCGSREDLFRVPRGLTEEAMEARIVLSKGEAGGEDHAGDGAAIGQDGPGGQEDEVLEARMGEGTSETHEQHQETGAPRTGTGAKKLTDSAKTFRHGSILRLNGCVDLFLHITNTP